MERQPSKEEILFEWFLGDSKEIVGELKTAVEQAQALQQSMINAGTGIDASVNEAKQELIIAQRELTTTIREIEARHRQTRDQLEGQAKRVLAMTQRRTVRITAFCAAVGGVFGGIAAALLLAQIL